MLTVFFILTIVSGCSFGKVYTDAIEQTDEYLVNEQFDKAFESIQIALDEKPEDDVALNIESGLLKYKELEKYKEKREWAKVSEVINSFGTLDSVHPKLKKQVDETKKYMTEQVNLEEQISEDVTNIKASIDNNKFEEADIILSELETNSEIEFAREDIISIREEYNRAYAKYIEEEKKAKRKQQLDNILLKFEKKLVEAETLEKELEKHKKLNNQEKSIQALNKIEITYDDLLNDVYQTIIEEFPKKEEKLREVQREWLANYENERLNTRCNHGDIKELEASVRLKKERTKELLSEYF